MYTHKTENYIQSMNRPLLEIDLNHLYDTPHSVAIKELVREYKQQGLPVMNGGFHYSNFVEGPAQYMTCLPYRLWEYSSLFNVIDTNAPKDTWSFLDVGGAGSPLVYYLAEQGCQGVTVDLQPFLADITNYVARVRSLNLQALVGDITSDFNWENEFGLVVFVSVLEHIAPNQRVVALERIYRALKPGGVLYMTFDYGNYEDSKTSYLRHESDYNMTSGSISDIEGLCALIERLGFLFVDNDPRYLDPEVLGLMVSPQTKKVLWQRSLNLTIDGETPWKDILKYVYKRVFRHTGIRSSRFDQHNFFRIYLRKPEIDV
jgi:SAM-dependent methyltransferase